ncbi:hypothetical protein MVES_002630 [Malassezia vespertilionis]|uniref:Uncharacterized protein n=1 Tax=Malassezia vespertilionis TaxID=2020962 RepID=A0A2N1JB08_9BASI|nr:hypothetical protein MVES_002630 [Malassezia vespertilionis]
MDWMNSVPYVDPRNAQSPLLPSLYNAPMPPFAMANATTAQLTQQLSALQLQNQQSEHLVLQEQQRLLSEIQAAQELQAMLAQHQEAPQKLMSTALETASDSKVKRGGATEHLHNVSQSVQRETPDASFRRSRPISYGNRDSTGSAGQRLSGLYKNERTVPPQTLDRARNTTPSIVINQDAKAAGPSQADVNAVGMRIGPIITNSAEEHEYRPEKDKKRQSLSDKARANDHVEIVRESTSVKSEQTARPFLSTFLTRWLINNKADTCLEDIVCAGCLDAVF